MNNLYIGLLSGTSMDAIDCALVDFSLPTPQLLAAHSFPMPSHFKEKCLHITNTGQCRIDEYAMLDVEAGELFAEAALSFIEKYHIKAENIRAIGSHGQTLRHRPDLSPPFTLQIGDPHIIAERTRITVVADVRRRDMAAGGQGAPLAPGFHESVFRHVTENRVILNIGGISNLTIIPSNLDQPLLGFDTGPGNGLMDAWIAKIKQLSFDLNGEFAASGKIIEPLLHRMLCDPYFELPHPKSTGREYFNLQWLDNYIAKYKSSYLVSELFAADVQATLVELTARSLAKEIQFYTNDSNAITTIYACGGGVKNPVLMNALSKHTQRAIQTTAALGVPSEWVEAMLFAWIAKQTLEGKSSNCPSVTGASHAVPLGGIFTRYAQS